MLGLMQETPLSIPALLEFSALNHADTPIVSVNGGVRESYDYHTLHRRSLRLAGALRGAGILPGDRVATLAWNDHRHLEAFFAIPGIGAITHTLNPRLSIEQLVYIVDHARDRLLLADEEFLPLVRDVLARTQSVEMVVVLGRAPTEFMAGRPAVAYETFLDSRTALDQFERFPETTACGLCYTSGTTGDPKGVLYSHRSTVLHALSACSADALAISSSDVVLPAVPMFHANAWGIPFVCALTGAGLVLPGGRLDAASLLRLIREELVTFAAAIPTLWARLLDYADAEGTGFGGLVTAGIGGAPPGRALLERLRIDHQLEVFHGWGMTETSPLGGTGRLRRGDRARPIEEQIEVHVGQGRELFGLERRLVDDQGRVLPRNDRSPGHLQVRGPWVVRQYFGTQQPCLQDGWFDTGDIATLDAHGRLRIVDRAKDMIKSGGEWISSLELESLAARHPDVAEVAAIAVADERWGERPQLIVRLRGGVPGEEAADRVRRELREIMGRSLASWQLPERIEFIAQMPYGATGKIDKTQLRRSAQS